MSASRLPCFVLAATVVTVGAFIVLTDAESAGLAPASAGASGALQGWLARHGFTAYMLAWGIAFPLFLTAAIRWIPRLVPRWVNLPNPAYWLAPQRRHASLAYLGRHACWLGAALSLTAGALHALLLRAGRLDPPRIETGYLLAVLVLAAAAIIAWALVLQRRFRLPGA